MTRQSRSCWRCRASGHGRRSTGRSEHCATAMRSRRPTSGYCAHRWWRPMASGRRRRRYSNARRAGGRGVPMPRSICGRRTPSMSDELFLDTMKTPIGELLLVADARGVLQMLEFEDKPERWRSIFRRHFKNGEFQKRRDPGGVSTKLKRYFDGDIAALDEIEVNAQGTDFQHACWKNLRRIPAGTSTTYGALAKKMGKPAAMRAV